MTRRQWFDGGLCVGVLVFVVWCYGWVLSVPPSEIMIVADWRQIQKPLVAKAVEGVVRHHPHFFSLQDLQGALVHVPWVESATLKRIGHHGLHVQLVPQQVVARLTAGRWLLADGRVVHAIDTPFASERLPIFDGEDGDFPRMLVFYRQMRHALLKAPWQIRVVRYRAFSTQWQVELSDDILIRLGKASLAQAHFDRWIRAWPMLKKRHHHIGQHYYDMRYPDGFAVGALKASA